MTLVSVATSAELISAIAGVVGGDRIELAPGDYGALSLKNLAFLSDVTIISADSTNPAIVHTLYVSDSIHIVLDGIHFDYVNVPEDKSWVKPFQVLSSSFITIRNSVFDGAEIPSTIASGTYGTGFGLKILGSNNITIEHNEFFGWMKAFHISYSAAVVASFNDVHTIRSDGFNFIAVDGLLVEGNWLHDFKLLDGSGDHPDMVQFWTVVDSAQTRDATIARNFFDVGAGGLTQSLFFGNASSVTSQLSFENYAYKNILIENNVIYNAHSNGIFVSHADGLVIRNNTILHDSVANDPNKAGSGYPIIHVSDLSLNATIDSNIIGFAFNWDEIVNHLGWAVAQNLIVQRDDSNSENYYGDLFVDALTGMVLADLRAVAGGLIEVGGYGAEMTRADIPTLAGPYATAPGPDPVPEPGVCEALLAEALGVVADLEGQLAAVQAALAIMTIARDTAQGERDAAFALQVIAETERDVALGSLAAMTIERDVAAAKLDEIRVIVN